VSEPVTENVAVAAIDLEGVIIVVNLKVVGCGGHIKTGVEMSSD
jgi:hypothetical protein